MDWKSWCLKLLKKPIFVTRGTNIKKKAIRFRCQEGMRVLTEEQALELKKEYEGIPLNMLELAAEGGCFAKSDEWKRNKSILSKISYKGWGILSALRTNAF